MANYIVGFLYLIYFVFFTHFVSSVSWDSVLFFFSKTSLYFSILTVLFYSLMFLINKFIRAETIYKTPFLKSLNEARNNLGLTTFIILILSHFLAVSNYLQPISLIIAQKIGYHQNLFLTLLGLIIFSIGIYIFKFSNKKIMIVALMLLFIHGVYEGILWNSLYQQKNVYENVYNAGVKNNIILHECKEIVCVKVTIEDFDELIKAVVKGQPNTYIGGLVESYLIAFKEYIGHSSDNLVTFSYGDGIKGFVSGEYAPIGVYNKESNYLLIDYKKLENIVSNHNMVYKRITGIATIFWLGLLFLMIGWHHWLKMRRLKKVSK